MLEGLSREAKLVLSCAAGSDKVDFEQPDLNWDTIQRIAQNHRLVPVLYDFLSSSARPGIPSHVLSDFHILATRISARNSILTRELMTILTLFEENRIPVVPYKGPTLAHRLYGNIALRDFDDLDLLIQKKDVLNAKNILLAKGYLPKKVLFGLTVPQEQALLRSQYTYDFILNEPNHQLEVHWAVVPKAFSLNLDYEGLWNRSIRITFDKKEVLAFCPEDLLLILCISGVKKLWDRLSRVLDIARTISQYPAMKWPLVLQLARDARAERILDLGLLLATTLFEVRLPKDQEERAITDPKVQALANSIVNRMFVVERPPSMILDDDQFQPLHMQVRERFADRARYFLSLTFTPGVAEWALLSLPGYLYFLYHLLRPIRLVCKAAKRVPKTLRRMHQKNHATML